MANPFSWASYTAPNMTPVAGAAGNFNFFRPEDSKMPTGAALGSYLMPHGSQTLPGDVTNRTVKYDGALTREQLGNSTNFLNGQLGAGFQGIDTRFNELNDAMKYGGNFGDRNTPVYSPTTQNGYGTGWGGSNPFKIGSF